MVHRAWIELNVRHLAHNIHTIRQHLPTGTELMPVLKGNAYGHGSQEIIEELRKLEVSTVAVATIEEAMEIRKADYQGNILIFSYTPLEKSQELLKWNLIQTLIDYPYAKELSSMDGRFRVHIKVDTGMNRLGERHSDVEKVQSIFQLENLQIEGIYSHFSRSDRLDPSDVEFTSKQVKRFNELLSKLEALDIKLPKTHIQNSYGLLNFPHLTYDYARIGTLIYGVHSDYSPTILKLPLQPVLSLKTKVIIIKHVPAGDTIGYGKENVIDVDKKIAVLPIGYADGVPKQLSTYKCEALVRGRRVPIIGSVSMNHMMIDITDYEDIQVADIVTLIGNDHNETIAIEEIATKIGSASDEVFIALASKLKRVRTT
ncbi:alanine racemase [Lysinibacillus yapensis]|uniref:Alanine racemase n=1 Tax=Ureibacillus yapensis TaxID=2304605 RepID=A0A396S9B3_9BACL|nr:alanine racemase [Lysinibacillus yapensis]RHW37494.1 alanine racemase [Lysinibacillus yapensis]